MRQDLEELIRGVFRQWKQGLPETGDRHPDEDEFVSFIEGSLAEEEKNRIKEHIMGCDACAEILSLSIGDIKQDLSVPEELLESVRGLVIPEDKSLFFEVVLRLKDDLLELINTSGDVLVGQEFLPAPILRSRSIKDFKDEVRILKDIKDFRVEVKVEAKSGKAFNLVVVVKEKRTQKVLKDLRISLLKAGTELESYISGAGAVVFEHVSLGDYRIDISKVEEKVESVIIII
ncbi:MAG: zf-HC2 domain-containing protein, partial [Candidatus Omnitrophica bacterium]|nr:zf-HC2 domain-containing protein [Candidatus Omnitrophota bacterium]